MDPRPRVQARVVAYFAGAAILVVLGLMFLIVSLVNGGGVAIVILAVPVLTGGVLLFLRSPWARVWAVVIAVVYALVIAYIATTPWRGLTPPAGQPRQQLDLSLIALSAALGIAAALIATGRSPRKEH